MLECSSSLHKVISVILFQFAFENSFPPVLILRSKQRSLCVFFNIFIYFSSLSKTLWMFAVLKAQKLHREQLQSRGKPHLRTPLYQLTLFLGGACIIKYLCVTHKRHPLWGGLPGRHLSRFCFLFTSAFNIHVEGSCWREMSIRITVNFSFI